jgi:flagellar biosynthetic protein FliO
MAKPVTCLILFFLLFIPAQSSFSQPNPDIGSFDIEKVRKAAGNESAVLSPDSPNANRGSVPARATENWGLVILRITIYLAITIGAIFLVIWGIKRIGLAGRSKIGGGSMDVLEALPLGPNRSIILVRVVDKVYLIGQTQNGMNVLETIEGQKALELISSTKGVVSMGQFKEVFGSFMGRFRKQ